MLVFSGSTELLDILESIIIKEVCAEAMTLDRRLILLRDTIIVDLMAPLLSINAKDSATGKRNDSSTAYTSKSLAHKCGQIQ